MRPNGKLTTNVSVRIRESVNTSSNRSLLTLVFPPPHHPAVVSITEMLRHPRSTHPRVTTAGKVERVRSDPIPVAIKMRALRVNVEREFIPSAFPVQELKYDVESPVTAISQQRACQTGITLSWRFILKAILCDQQRESIGGSSFGKNPVFEMEK
ncbi:hypothetical protein J6590_003837 [Homalodisca vitripennis]|nr:hypothetical protein J6590_003837 [Homalodisca vitripennis]